MKKVDEFLDDAATGFIIECTRESKNALCCAQAANEMRRVAYIECVNSTALQRVLDALQAAATALTELCEKLAKFFK